MYCERLMAAVKIRGTSGGGALWNKMCHRQQTIGQGQRAWKTIFNTKT